MIRRGLFDSMLILLKFYVIIIDHVSTVGYGNIYPVTFEGKLVTMIFAIIGIPINYWYIFKLGSLFAATVMTLVRSCYKKMRYFYIHKTFK